MPGKPPRLDSRINVGMPTGDRRRLDMAAARLGVQPGTLARALILAGLDQIATPEVAARVEQVTGQAHRRRSVATSATARARWAKRAEESS